MPYTTATPTAAWYPDPAQPALLRWWDGSQWTTHTAPRPAPDTRGNGSARFAVGITLTILGIWRVPMALLAFLSGEPFFQAVGGLFFAVALLTTGILLWVSGSRRRRQLRS